MLSDPFSDTKKELPVFFFFYEFNNKKKKKASMEEFFIDPFGFSNTWATSRLGTCTPDVKCGH